MSVMDLNDLVTLIEAEAAHGKTPAAYRAKLNQPHVLEAARSVAFLMKHTREARRWRR